MALYVNTDAHVTVNSVDLSDHVKSAQITINGEIQDVSAMSTTWRQRLPGVNDWKLEVEFFDDIAASKTFQTLDGIVNTSVTVIYGPVATGMPDTTAPQWTGTAILESFAPGGSWGETAMLTATFLGDSEPTGWETS